MPTISVIVPVYKVEPYLRRCVDSILAQTFTDFELILVDDGSPDECPAICDEYAGKDARVRVIHQENGGLSAARNAGLEIAAGDWIAFIDSDDFVAPIYLEYLLGLVQANGAEVSVCEMLSFEDGTEPELPPIDESAEPLIMSGREACEHIYRMDGILWVAAWSKLFASRLFTTLRFPVGMVHEDQATTPIAIYGAVTVIVSKKQLYDYRVRNTSITGSSFSIKRFDDVDAVEICIRHFEAQGDLELAELARGAKKAINAKCIVEASKAGLLEQVPAEYQMTEAQALKILRQYTKPDTYEWYLFQLHPLRGRLYAYGRRLRQMLGRN